MTRSNLALKYSERNIWIGVALKIFLIQKQKFIASNEEKHVVEMGAWEVSNFKAWTQSKAPNL